MTNELRCWCRHCKAELPPDHKGPCPKCGKLGKHFEATLRTTIGLAASLSAQKVHKYTKKHPWVIAISIVLTIVSISVGYLLGDLVGLLIGIILAILNLWLTPRVKETIVEITHLGNKEEEVQEAKVENNTQQKKTVRIKDIYQKLEDIEIKIDSSSQIQKFAFIYALGAAFIILGLSFYFALLQSTGSDMTTFYLINIPGLLALGTFALVYAFTLSRGVGRKTEKQKGVQQMGTKGRKNPKKPKQKKEKKK